MIITHLRTQTKISTHRNLALICTFSPWVKSRREEFRGEKQKIFKIWVSLSGYAIVHWVCVVSIFVSSLSNVQWSLEETGCFAILGAWLIYFYKFSTKWWFNMIFLQGKFPQLLLSVRLPKMCFLVRFLYKCWLIWPTKVVFFSKNLHFFFSVCPVSFSLSLTCVSLENKVS